MRRLLSLFGIIFCSVLLVADDTEPTLSDLVNRFWRAESRGAREEAAKALKERTTDVFAILNAFEEGIRYSDDVKRGWSVLEAEAKDGKKRHFCLFVPQTYKSEKPARLLIHMHGGVSRPVLIPPPRLQKYSEQWWTEMAEKNNIILAFPAGQRGAVWWDSVGTSNVMEVIRQIKRRYRIDDDKVFATGFSDGGSGTYHLAFHYPTPFAGFIPLNGSSLVAQFGGAIYAQNLLLGRPLHIVNTTDDPLYPAKREKVLVEVFKKAGGNIDFKVYENIRHEARYLSKERPRITDFIEKTTRQPLPKEIVWLTDDVKERGRCVWVVIEEAGETGGEKPQLLNAKVSGRLILGVVVDRRFGGEGTRIGRVSEGSTADKMGIKAGDVIVKMDGEEIKAYRHFVQALRKKDFGDEITVTVKRDGKEVVLKGRFPPKQEMDAFNLSKPFSAIKVKVSENRIDVSTYRVKKYRLLISHKMFPKEAELKVYTNGELSFSGKVKPDVDLFLRYAAEDMDREMLFYGSVVVELKEKETEKKNKEEKKEEGE